jgi:ATP-dependent DNA helicase RecQ
VRRVYDAVCNAGQVPIGSEPDGPLAVNLDAVLKITGFSRTKVRTAVSMIERQGAWSVLPQRRHYGLIRFAQPANDLRAYARNIDNEALADFVRSLLRTVHADAFRDWWRIDVRRLERRTDLDRERLLRGLRYLQERGLLHWRPPGSALQVDLAFPRASKIPVDDRAVQTARRRAEQRLDTMLRYARSLTCRRRFLLAYFGQESPERCGACDVCMGRHRPETITPDDEPVLRQILERVREGKARAEWFDDPPGPAHHIDALADWLVANGYLEAEAPLEGRFALTDAARKHLGDAG